MYGIYSGKQGIRLNLQKNKNAHTMFSSVLWTVFTVHKTLYCGLGTWRGDLTKNCTRGQF